MKLSLEAASGLPVSLDMDSCELSFDGGLNQPSFCVRKLHDLNGVWANVVPDADKVIYHYTDGLWLEGDEAVWRDANVIHGIVVFTPGVYGGEYVKSSGQYHPPTPPSGMATPEIYTVLSGVGHFLLQKSSPPYKFIEDAVMVEVQAGESFVVPPDYGHLQINPSPEPLVFSYTVMGGMKGVYDPFRAKKGAIYYEMAEGPEQFVFNEHYGAPIPLRVICAGDICQLPELNNKPTYKDFRDHLPELKFLTDPTLFPESGRL